MHPCEVLLFLAVLYSITISILLKEKPPYFNVSPNIRGGQDFEMLLGAIVKKRGESVNILEKCYRKDASVVSRVIEDENILVPIRQNVADLESIYTLNEVGARIWDLIDGKNQVRKIKEQIVQEFGAAPKVAEEDILEFIAQLEEIGAVKVC